MATLSPNQKKALSGLAVVLGGALLTWANASLRLLPEGWQGIVGAILAGIAHYVPAAGTEQAVVQKLEGKPWAANVQASGYTPPQPGEIGYMTPEQVQMQIAASRQLGKL